MPPREVTVACENPRAGKRVSAYDRAVLKALERAGISKDHVDWAYVERLRLAGAMPTTAAAMVVPKPHAHTVVGVAAESRREEQVVPATACACATVEKQEQLESDARARAVEEQGTTRGGAFTKTVKDPTRFEAARQRAAAIGHLDSDAQLHRFLREDLEKEDQEVFVVVGLDIHNDLRCYAEVARGQRHSVRVEPADILRPILIEGCAGFVVAHNHPSGSAAPSLEDRKLTDQLRSASTHVRVLLVDHLVIGSGGSYYSFADKKLKRAK